VARTELERTVQPSLLDRLTDEQPGVTADPPVGREESRRAFRRSVERDVESLLNSRRTMIVVPPECREVRRSVFAYGLIDTTGIPVGTKAGRERLLSGLHDAIDCFEPRLGDVRVRLVDADQKNAPQMRFVVEAILRMDPSPEQVVFDTVLEVSSGEYDVLPADAASATD
jgi:type VI secretion system protein ImpF